MLCTSFALGVPWVVISITDTNFSGAFIGISISTHPFCLVNVRRLLFLPFSSFMEAISTINPVRYRCPVACHRSEEHTSELQSLMRISYALFSSNKKEYRLI